MNRFIAAILLCFCALSGRLVWAIEEPAFDVVLTRNGIEYRQYQPYLVANTRIDGQVSRDKAASIGFRRLFKYIRGANQKNAKISMTAPVRQQQDGTKIAMTAPVRQGKSAGDWSVAFVLPDSFSIVDVPQPVDPDISIQEMPGNLVAVRRYSGRWSESNVSAQTLTLMDRLAGAELEAIGEVAVAYYNSPFSLPFMRRNEVLVAVSGLPVEK